MRAVLQAFPGGRTVVLLDNFEDVVDPQTFAISDVDAGGGAADGAHRAASTVSRWSSPPGWPHGSWRWCSRRCSDRIDLDEGLASPYAENILQGDGRRRDAGPEDTLRMRCWSLARERTRGYPAGVGGAGRHPDRRPQHLAAGAAGRDGQRAARERGRGAGRGGVQPARPAGPAGHAGPGRSTAGPVRRWRWTTCCSRICWPSTAPRCWAGWSTCSSSAVTPAATTCTRSTATTRSAASRPGGRPTAEP